MKPSSTQYPFSELDTLHHINFYSRDNWTLVRRERKVALSGALRSFRIEPCENMERRSGTAGTRGKKNIGVEVLEGLLAIERNLAAE
jgi:hypothetical protein